MTTRGSILTEGYLIFGKPVNGAPLTAVFSAEVEGGDAEILLLPPNRSERKSLAAYTGTPNLDEHFTNAVFFFTGAQGSDILAEIRSQEDVKKSPEIGALMAEQGSPIVNNIATSFESRMVLDLLMAKKKAEDSFEAVIRGRKLGNFDFTYDPRLFEQFSAGQLGHVTDKVTGTPGRVSRTNAYRPAGTSTRRTAS